MKSIIKKTAQKIFKSVGFELVELNKPDDTALYRKLYSNDSVENKRFYNVCSGGHVGFGNKFSHPCWRNLDLKRDIPGWNDTFDPQKDIDYDMLLKHVLPIDDNSAEIIQSRFSIEHVHDEAAFYFLKEAYRALKPNGIIKIVVPNIELDYMAYRYNDRSYFAIESMSDPKNYRDKSGFTTPFNQASFEQIFLSRLAANATMLHGGNNPNKINDEEFKKAFASMPKEEAFTYCSSRCSVEVQKNIRFNHINWWNHNKTVKALEHAGFNDIQIVAPGQSSSPVLRNTRYFDNLWNWVALFVEARKL